MKNLIEVCKKYDITINDTSNKSYIMLIKNDEIIALLKANDKESYLFYKLDLFKNFGKLEINSVAKTKEEIKKTESELKFLYLIFYLQKNKLS